MYSQGPHQHVEVARVVLGFGRRNLQLALPHVVQQAAQLRPLAGLLPQPLQCRQLPGLSGHLQAGGRQPRLQGVAERVGTCGEGGILHCWCKHAGEGEQLAAQSTVRAPRLESLIFHAFSTIGSS